MGTIVADHQHGTGTMRGVNRAVVVLHPKQPFIDWARVQSAGPKDAILEHASEPVHAYLVPGVPDDLDYDKLLRRYYGEMFRVELAAWVTDEDCWPKKRDLKAFKEWFAPDVLELVFDLTDNKLVALPVEE